MASAQDTPEPGKYNQKSEFDVKDVKKRGYSFTSRPKSGGILDQSVGITPGPGSYHTDEKRLHRNISYTIGKSTDHIHNNSVILEAFRPPAQGNTIFRPASTTSASTTYRSTTTLGAGESAVRDDGEKRLKQNPVLLNVKVKQFRPHLKFELEQQGGVLLR